MISRIAAIAGLLTLGIAHGEPSKWRMKDGKVIDAEIRCIWGEDDTAMVEFLTRDVKLLTVKRSEIHPEELKRIPALPTKYEDYRFAWATAYPDKDQPGKVKITFRFQRNIPGVKGCDESTLKVAPFKIGHTLIPSDAWKVTNASGPDGAVMEFHTTGDYDASKLMGSKFSASLEVEVGKDRKRAIQNVDFPKRPGQTLKSKFGDIEIESVSWPVGQGRPMKYGVIVRTEPKEKLIRHLMESNGRTGDLGGMEASVAGTFATVKIDYWESFEKKIIQFAGTAGISDIPL